MGNMASGKSIFGILGAIALVVMLTACSAVGANPSRQLVKQAIALELSQTQQLLSQQLRLDLPPNSLTIHRVSIEQTTPLKIEDLQAYQVRGTYDYTIKLPTRKVTQRQNPFEVYLQRQQEGKIWRLAKQQISENGKPIWVTQRIGYD